MASHAEVTIRLRLNRHDHSRALTDEALRAMAMEELDGATWMDWDGDYEYRVIVLAAEVNESEVYNG